MSEDIWTISFWGWMPITLTCMTIPHRTWQVYSVVIIVSYTPHSWTIYTWPMFNNVQGRWRLCVSFDQNGVMNGVRQHRWGSGGQATHVGVGIQRDLGWLLQLPDLWFKSPCIIILNDIPYTWHGVMDTMSWTWHDMTLQWWQPCQSRINHVTDSNTLFQNGLLYLSSSR